MTAVDVITQAAASASFAKVLVDICKRTFEQMPRNYLPAIALVMSEICSFLLAATTGSLVFNVQVISGIVLMGIGATAGAMAITQGQTKADKVEERLDIALSLERGSKKSDVDAAMIPPKTEP